MSLTWVNPYLLELEYLDDGDTVYVETDHGVVSLPIEEDYTGGVILTYDGEHLIVMESLINVVDVLENLIKQLKGQIAVRDLQAKLKDKL